MILLTKNQFNTEIEQTIIEIYMRESILILISLMISNPLQESENKNL